MLDWTYLKPLLAIGLGAAVGIVYARLTRCTTGTCPITSNAWTAGLFGGAVGLMLTINLAGAPGRPGQTEKLTKDPMQAPVATAGPQEGEKVMARQIESESEFESEVLQASKPVLVDFYATWCGPCRLLTPLLDQIATELAGRADIVKVDVDKVGEVAARYRIMGVPTVMLFDQGKVVKTFVGVRSKADYLAAINQTVAK